MNAKGLWRGIVGAAAIVAAAFAALAATVGSAAPVSPAENPSRAPAQARTLVKYIVSGSIEIPAAAGIDFFDRGLDVDSAGNLYVGVNNQSTSGPDIAVLDPSGRLLRQWSAAPFGDGPLIAIGADGLVYVQNRAERFVRVFTPEGVELVARRIEHGAVNTKDIEVDAAGNVYVVGRGRGDGGPYSDDGVFRFSSAGQLTGYLVPRPGTRGDDVIGAVAVAPDGSVYITAFVGQGGVVLYHLDASGNKLPVFDPRFFLPGNYYDVEFANGRLYFSGPLKGPAAVDHTPVAVAVFSPQGELIDFTVGTLNEPNYLTQLAVGGEKLYVRALLASGRELAQSRSSIGVLKGVPTQPDPNSSAHVPCGVTSKGPPPIAVMSGISNACDVTFHNFGSPCRSGWRSRPFEAFFGGESIGPPTLAVATPPQHALVRIPKDKVKSGAVVVAWECVSPDQRTLDVVYEWKGDVLLIDPSGNAIDASTGRPIPAASVRLQFSVRQGGPFGTPAPAGYKPQLNPQITPRDGSFRWDVAEGFWRLRITAFGYRPFTSPVYKVPPEVTGLKLRLTHNPAQQRLLLDPHLGKAGPARLGQRAQRAAGLQLRIVGGRVRSITVRSGRFRTTHGIRLGSTGAALIAAYPTGNRRTVSQLTSATRSARYRVGKATFVTRRGRIVAIRLGS